MRDAVVFGVGTVGESVVQQNVRASQGTTDGRVAAPRIDDVAFNGSRARCLTACPSNIEIEEKCSRPHFTGHLLGNPGSGRGR